MNDVGREMQIANTPRGCGTVPRPCQRSGQCDAEYRRRGGTNALAAGYPVTSTLGKQDCEPEQPRDPGSPKPAHSELRLRQQCPIDALSQGVDCRRAADLACEHGQLSAARKYGSAPSARCNRAEQLCWFIIQGSRRRGRPGDDEEKTDAALEAKHGSK